MERDKGPIARLMTGVGGAVLVGSVFISWYSLSMADVLRGVASQLPPGLAGRLPSVAAAAYPTLTWSGWNALHLIRFVVVVVGLAALVASIAGSGALGDRLLLPAGGLLAVVLVAYRIESPPPTIDISVGPLDIQTPQAAGLALSSLLRVDLGAWIAVLGGVLVIIGSLLALADGRAAVAGPSPTSAGGPSAAATADLWTW